MTYHAPPIGTSVLIVEDEALVRLVTAGIMVEHGFEVLEAGNGKQALSHLESGQRIDVLFTDVNMPGEPDGIGLARLVRARWPQTMILITSGRAGPHIDRSLGQFVPKPYLPDHVARTIARMVASRAKLPCPVG